MKSVILFDPIFQGMPPPMTQAMRRNQLACG
jgi:hypothetical protein